MKSNNSRDKHEEVCQVIEDIFTPFNGEFIGVKDKSESEVRKYINDALEQHGLKNINLDYYVYIAETNGTTIIKSFFKR